MGSSLQQRALVQQGYAYSPAELDELSWGLRFTPAVCMAGAVVGLALRAPAVHFAMAALGILPFWFPAGHPLDWLYNHALRPLWGGVPLPPNPLPRRIACLMGGAMNAGIGAAFVAGQPVLAYALGAALLALQLIVITSHFCVASWLFDGLRRTFGARPGEAPIEIARAHELVTAGAWLIDVRSPAEFARGHLAGARNVPLEQVAELARTAGGRELICYCQSGMRSRRAVRELRRQGLATAHDLGAMARYDSAGD
jgi:rhodanese-related sulfurtransferase